jgi:thioredoxin reductase (NADPH)
LSQVLLGERAETIEKQKDGSFIVTSNEGTKFHAKVVAMQEVWEV